jgi:hypothetical protein
MRSPEREGLTSSSNVSSSDPGDGACSGGGNQVSSDKACCMRVPDAGEEVKGSCCGKDTLRYCGTQRFA